MGKINIKKPSGKTGRLCCLAEKINYFILLIMLVAYCEVPTLVAPSI